MMFMMVRKKVACRYRSLGQIKPMRARNVKDVKLWIFDADKGSMIEEKHYGSTEEVASQRFQLPEGTYCIQTFSNLTKPFFISEQTRALTNWNNILIGLTNPKDVRNNAYFGVTDVKIDNKEGNYVVQTQKKKVLAELTIIIENIPKGTEMSGKALDCAWCLFPTQKNSDGEVWIAEHRANRSGTPYPPGYGINPEIGSHPTDADHTGKLILSYLSPPAAP